MNRSVETIKSRSGRRTAALTSAAVLMLPPLLGTAALPSSAAVVTATETPAPANSPTAPIGGVRLGERGLVFSGGAPAPPTTSAASYVVADADTGAVLAALDPHGRKRPASTLKTLLALTMLPRLDPDSDYTADRDDTNVDGSRVGMVPGQDYRIRDLWYALMVRSGNDAANGLAKAGAGGDRAKGVRMMNAEARRLQAFDTTAVNPSGLDEDGQFSSAYDLTLFARAGLARRDFSTYARTIKREFPGNQTKTATAKTSKPFQMYTSNRLLLRGYPGAIGVKTGYTTLARNTLIAAAERDGRKIIVTLMGEPPGTITKDAEALLDWGIANAGTTLPVGALVEPTSLSLITPEDGVANGAGISVREKEGITEVAARSGLLAEESRRIGLSSTVLGGLAAVVMLVGLAARKIAVRRQRRFSHGSELTTQNQADARTVASRSSGSEAG